MSIVHVIGAGVAGLAAALSLAEAGRQVVLHESGPAAGGRCRSYFDRGLGVRLDNGNHLLLSGNHAVMAYLTQIGARHSLTGPGEAMFPFMDLGTGERWTISPSAGRIPWWVLDRRARVPGTRLGQYIALLRLLRVRDDASVAAVLSRAGPLYTRLLEPLAVAALNTRPDRALARLLGRVVLETLARGGAACVPSFPRVGLSESFVDPAVEWLRARGATLRLASRVTGLHMAPDHTGHDRLARIDTAHGPEALAAGDAVVLATPAHVAADLMPGLVAPDQFEAIANVHFRLESDRQTLGRAGFVGLVGGTAEWVFQKPGIISVTVSAANDLIDLPSDELAARIWPEVRAVATLSGPMPAMRVVKERRATFAATAEQDRRRPATRTALANLVLAGDWTATGLPATIEGAIRSGRTAAAHLLAV